LEKRFFKTFSAENSIFSQHFWGKIFREIFRGIFPGKKRTKNRPLKMQRIDRHASKMEPTESFFSCILYAAVFY
jgi:hypothetical protein